MNTRHVPSLELCQEFDRLCKEKGIVVPDTEFVWYKSCFEDDCEFVLMQSKGFYGHSAPLVSELGEWLPETVEMYNEGEDVECFLTYLKGHQKRHRVDYLMIGGQATTMELWEADTEANARQKMLNYLIAEGIITTLCQPT